MDKPIRGTVLMANGEIETYSTIDELDKILNSEEKKPVKINPDSGHGTMGRVVCESISLHENTSLHDWFAGMALQGICAGRHVSHSESEHAVIAQRALSLASAMLAARKAIQSGGGKR